MTDSTLISVLNGDAPEKGPHAACPAIVIPSSTGSPHSFTHAQLFTEVLSAAAQLQPYINKGDLVSLAFVNDIELVIAFLGVTRAGAVSAPLNAAYTEEEFKFYIEGERA